MVLPQAHACAINVAPEIRVHGEREFGQMNRFFSKLNLADIKIKAEGNSFPPDSEAEEDQTEEPEALTASESPASVATAEPVIDDEPAVEETYTGAEVDIPVSSNGHGDP